MRYREIINEDELPPLRIDNREGMGAIPDGANIDYMGVRVMMKPSQFLRLAAQRDFNASSSLKAIMDELRKGRAIGAPFLDVDFGDGNGDEVPAVKQHEGRTRMEAIRRLYGDIPVEVHLFPRGGYRARHITPAAVERFRMEAMPQRINVPLSGPHFVEAISHRA